jgi:putative ABC transport system permease protein
MAARKLRSALSLISVALGVALLVALLTLNASMDRAVEAQLTKLVGTYDLMVGYRKPDIRLSGDDLAEVARQPGVTDTAGVLIPYMYESHRELRPDLSYYGAPDTALGRQFMPIGEGAFPRPGEAALSASWAKKAGVKVGDTLRLAFPPGGEREVRVSGIMALDKGVSTGIALFERGWLEAATGRSGATFVLVNTAKGADYNLIVGSLQRRFPDLEGDVRKFRNELRRNMNSLRPLALGMGIAALLSAGFLLAASFRMSLAERTRELALLRAVGATPRQVRRLILAEGLFVGLAGALAGVGVGVAGAAAVAGFVARLLQVEPVPAVVPWGGMALAALAGMALTLLSGYAVARAAARTEPLWTMRPDLPAQEQSARQGGWFGIGLAAVGAVAVIATPSVPTGIWGGA